MLAAATPAALAAAPFKNCLREISLLIITPPRYVVVYLLLVIPIEYAQAQGTFLQRLAPDILVSRPHE
jgi:hypothetical protein